MASQVVLVVKKESACQCRSSRRCGFDPWVGNIPWRKPWQPTPVFLLRKFHGQRSLVDYSPWGCKDLDMTEQLSTHTPLLDRIQQWRLQLLDFCLGGGFFLIIFFFFLAVLGFRCCVVFSLAVWGEQGLLSGCGAWPSHCSGFSYWGAWALGCPGIRSCGSWALECRLNSCGAWA